MAESSVRPEPWSVQSEPTVAPKKRKHRGGKKRRTRRQSFAATAEQPEDGNVVADADRLEVPGSSGTRQSSFRRRNASMTSIESEALLDHR